MNIINFVTIWILIGVICSVYVNYQYGKILLKQPIHLINAAIGKDDKNLGSVFFHNKAVGTQNGLQTAK